MAMLITLRDLLRASSSFSGKREPGVTSSSPPSIVGHFMGALTLYFTPQYHRGICGAQPLGIHDGEGGGASNSQHSDLGRLSSYLQSQVLVPTSGCAHMQNLVGGASNQGKDCQIQILRGGVLTALEPGLLTPRQRN